LLSRLFNRPWVLVILLALCLGTIVYAFWPAGAETLFARGSELMESTRSSDWERAWREYFEPLNRRFPDHPYQEQVESFRLRIEEARNPRPSEARPFFERAERLEREGSYLEARRAWTNLILVFQGVEREKEWVRRAEQALRELEKTAAAKERWQSVRPALARAQALWLEGRKTEAEKIWNALEELYGRDPFGREILDEVRRARQE
jgi:serine/threonine-protein kinase